MRDDVNDSGYMLTSSPGRVCDFSFLSLNDWKSQDGNENEMEWNENIYYTKQKDLFVIKVYLIAFLIKLKQNKTFYIVGGKCDKERKSDN